MHAVNQILIRRHPVANQELTRNDLLLMLQRLFPAHLSDPKLDLDLFYLDAAGDKCLLLDDSDLRHAMDLNHDLLDIEVHSKFCCRL